VTTTKSKEQGCNCNYVPTQPTKVKVKKLEETKREAIVVHLRNDVLLTTPSWTNFQLEKYLKDDTKPAFFVNKCTVFCGGLAKMNLCLDAQRIRDLPNAGGTSVASEAMSFEILKRTLQAQLLKTEMELQYFPSNSKITDYAVTMFGLTIGVSVTRAMNFRGKFTLNDAQRLLTKKLYGVVVSTQNVLDNFHKQILHVWIRTDKDARVLKAAYHALDQSLKSNTVVMVTVATNAEWIFFEPKCKI